MEEAVLRTLAKEGGILPDDLVWQPAHGNQWVAASSVPGLLAPSPPLPVPPIETTPGQLGNVPLDPDANRSPWQTIKGRLIPVGLALLVGFKYLASLKFLLPLLKTGGTMIFSIGAYAMVWGWRFAVGFVVLIFVHECGHLLAARRCGLKVGIPVFIPFMGAVIALKEAPRNAWIEAQVGIGGPILGSLGAAGCELIFLATGNPLFRALAYTGFFLNLFNLLPVGFLDGGRIVTALSPWLWLIGFLLLAGLTVLHLNLLLLLILLLSLPRLFSLFKEKSDEECRYFEVTPARRWVVGVRYFGLIALLILGMQMTCMPHRP